MNFSKITEQLYIGTTPNVKDYEILRDLGVRLVINMRWGLPPKKDTHSPAMESLWLPAIDSPIFPIPMRWLQSGVSAALEIIRAGGVVYTHCSRGRHRGPAMGACILIAQGNSALDAMQMIKQQRPVADPQVWYIRRRILKFAELWAKDFS
jgi:protein tyrosine phosphatase (PTP) superfamily phosphohydrolase (DUF442 family)